VPVSVVERLQALSQMSGKPQWRVISEAIDAYARQLPSDQRTLLETMLGRAGAVFAKPKIVKRPVRHAAPPVHVLNVDDNEAMLFARSKMLRAEGFTVIEARTGQDALEMIEAHRPRVVLLDVHLPDISGLEVCRRVKADDRFADIKVVQTSATFSSPKDQVHGLNSGGADFYLAEPFQRGMLLSVIRRLLD
jgi:CheY-like chemotaxis protein